MRRELGLKTFSSIIIKRRGTSYRAHYARRKAPRLLNCFFTFFINYSVLQYTILLISKLISFCVNLVNLLGSHTLILTEYLFFECTILTLLICILSTFFQSALLSLLSSLFSRLLSELSRTCLYILTDIVEHASWLTLGD